MKRTREERQIAARRRLDARRAKRRGECRVDRPKRCHDPLGASGVWCEAHETTGRYWERQAARPALDAFLEERKEREAAAAARPYPYVERHPGDEGSPP